MANNSGDPFVKNVQEWLNLKFGDDPRYNEIAEDGYIGQGTINAMIRGLQIRLGIQSTADNFGATTERLFKETWPNGIQQQADDDSSEDDVYGIIQGALICKGYSIGVASPTNHFYDGTGNAVKNLREDAGIDSTTSTVTLNLMKALLSMNYFYSYDNSQKTQNIQTIQRYLNGNYEAYIGLQPCDGVFGRGTSTAMIYALQANEKLPTNVANGNFGNTTKSTCPTIPYNNVEKDYNGNTYSSEDISKFVTLARMALYVNGFEESSGFSMSGEFNISLQNLIKEFQSFFALSETGTLDARTFASLLVSCGDRTRPAIACDCATIITNNNIAVLKDNNMQYIGRYLSGTAAGGVSKALSTEELQLLFNNGIRVFPIHQGSANSVSYFTPTQAEEDAETAVQYADALHLQFGAIIYFPVDCDPVDVQVTNYILPYFQKLQQVFYKESKGKYRIGVYGARNICTRVCNAGYACSSFVADMATGYSGNLGFKMPDNWAFDQFATVDIFSNDGTKKINIDKDGFSGRDIGIGQEYSLAESNDDVLNNTIANSFILINRSGSALPVYENKEHFDFPEATVGNSYRVCGSKIGEIKVNDFYVFFGIDNLYEDAIHKVLFHDGTDVKMGYVEGFPNLIGLTLDPQTSLNDGNKAQWPRYHEPFACVNYNPNTNEYNFTPFGNGNDYEFTINKPVVYFSPSGDFEGVLHEGDKIIISHGNYSNVGNSRPWCYRVSKLKKAGESDFQSFDKYVSVGLEYGSSGIERAWY